MKHVTSVAALMMYAAVAIAGIAGAVHLGMNDHPILAVILLLVVSGLSVKTGKAAEGGE